MVKPEGDEDSFTFSTKNRKKTNDICTIPDISSHPQQHVGGLWLLFEAVGVFLMSVYCIFLLQWLKV